MEVYVRMKDTLWYYSQLFNIPLVLIERSNPSVTVTQLQVGQRIIIPGYSVENYTIKKNDTLWKIAMNHNLATDALSLVNPTIDPSNLQIGRTIVIPYRIKDLIISSAENYTFDKMVTDFKRLRNIYPFVFQQTIGKSIMGKEMIELLIGVGKKEVHLNGSFHANEWITTPIIMQFINEYALALTNNTPIRGLFMQALYLSTTLSVVPMVNPDGVDLVINGAASAGNFREEVLRINNQNENFSNWKANIRGVDLNNQFPALWEREAERRPKTPQPRDYPGPQPLSESESIAMANLVRQRNFLRVNAFHTQGEEIYWGFEGFEPEVSEVIANEYARVSGYTPIRYVDSYAGFKDWFIQDFRRPGFTVELGKGVNPLPIEQFPEIYEKSLGIMLANLYV